MCGRFTFFDDKDIEEIKQILSEINERHNGVPIKTGEVFPTNNAAVITLNGDYRQVASMKWGFPRWDGKGVIINTRSETAAEKRMFAKPLEQTRCVIPTTGFYEWDTNKTKLIFSTEEPVLYLAGIYNTFGKEGEQYNAFSIFTRAANEYVKDIHNRMPVVLYKNELEDYLNDLQFANFVFNRDSVKLNREVAS